VVHGLLRDHRWVRARAGTGWSSQSAIVANCHCRRRERPRRRRARFIRSPRWRAALSMGVRQGREPWRS
jgi:hypothetical protein